MKKPLILSLLLTVLFFFSGSSVAFAEDVQVGDGGILIVISIIVIVIFIYNMGPEDVPIVISIILSVAIIYVTADYWLGVLASLLGVCVECVKQDYQYLLFPVIFLAVLILPIIYWIQKKLKL